MDRLLAPLLNKLDVLAERIAAFQQSVDGNTTGINRLCDLLEVLGLGAIGLFAVWIFVGRKQ